VIYIITDDQHIVMVVGPNNLAKMKAGFPMISPDGVILVAYTPDVQWTGEQIKAMIAVSSGKFDPQIVDFILKEGLRRPEVLL
jgi:hypothetical protein